ncbi:MAG: glycoside hydrolase family 172 protein [Acidobacteriota bacterium]
MSNTTGPAGRRGFLQRVMALTGASAVAPAALQAQGGGGFDYLPKYARAQNFKSLKQSSHDQTGGNADRYQIKPGATQELFNSSGPGVISHIWFTIAAPGAMHLKELVLRMYWEGNAKPCVETPVGDFFGLNLGQYQIYQSAYLACSPGRSLNCYFSMPFRRSARITVTNEGQQAVGAFYSNIDYMLAPSLPEDTMYFHAQYRQASPCVANTGSKLNPDGGLNYVYAEARGRGHIMGCTLGVLLNADGWMGEGDDMIFIDDETKPLIIGTGSEDYFLGSWNFGGRDGAVPFAHHYYGAPLIVMPERTGGRYCCYRWHGDNPVTFTRSMKYTMEHGHANDRGDNFFSAAYWYQSEPYTDFPPLPPVEQRIPRVKLPAA